jgi:hypothetical protein
MKANYRLFFGLSIFYFIVAVIYQQLGGEVLGFTGMLLSGCLAGMVGFYMWFTNRRIGAVLPEDNLSAEISDGAGELGFYSPHSWWRMPVALAATAAGLGLILGWWLTIIAVPTLIISIIGFVTEYEKPLATSSH